MKKKTILSILLICTVILIILLCILRMYSNQNDEKIDYYAQLAEKDYSEGKIMPQNYTPLMREYIGEVEVDVWFTTIYKLVNNYIPEIQNIKDMYQYYEENSEILKGDLGIDSYDNFVKLANNIKNISNSAKFKDSSFDITSMGVNENSIYAPLKIIFYNGEELNIKFIVYNKVTDNIKISFLVE